VEHKWLLVACQHEYACVDSSHWYLAIICFPYLVGVRQTQTAAHNVTAQQHQKQVVMCSVSLSVLFDSVGGLCVFCC